MIAAAILFYPIQTIVTWIFFLAIMDLKKARNAGLMTSTAEKFAKLVLFIGYPLDFLFNVTSSFIFLELPRELLFTSRVSRHIKGGSGWRSRLAWWYCNNFLNPFDPGHCS